MKASEIQGKPSDLLVCILEFVGRTTGLRAVRLSENSIEVTQAFDGKTLKICDGEIADILPRVDADGQAFIQVNFNKGSKILVTNTLIGFKPALLKGVDGASLPRVVTTPDILSVFEAIQDALDESEVGSTELVSLKRLFQAVIEGGESVGFNLSAERGWLNRIPSFLQKASS